MSSFRYGTASGEDATDVAERYIERHFYSLDTHKPGEDAEWAEALRNSRDKFTPDLALETADLVYYFTLKNAPPRRSLNMTLGLILGDDWERISEGFCVVKYASRLRFGDRPDFKDLERRIMWLHLSRLGRQDKYFVQ